MQIVSAEDEPLSRARLVHFCKDGSGLEMAGAAESVPEAVIDVEAIDYLESDGSHVAVHVDLQRYVARGTLKHFQTTLAPLGFVRVERSVLINLRKVAFAQRLERGAFAFTLRCGRRIISSRKYRRDILEEIRRAQFAGASDSH